MGEKTKGRKRHIVTDIRGNLLAIHVHTANKHDTKSGSETFLKALYRYPTLVGVCADAGYRGMFFIFITLFLGLVCDISEKIKLIGWQVLSKRWRVERNFWLVDTFSQTCQRL